MENHERKVSEEFVWKLLGEVKDANKEVSSDLKTQSEAIVNLINTFRKRFDGEPKTGELRNAIDSYATKFENYHDRIIEKFEACRLKEEEIYRLLREHCNHADTCFASIDNTLGDEDSFFQSILDKLESIKKGINSLTKRVWIMITVVCIAFSLLTVTYIFVKSTLDVAIEKKMTKVEKEHQDEIKHEIERLQRLIEKHIKQTENGKYK